MPRSATHLVSPSAVVPQTTLTRCLAAMPPLLVVFGVLAAALAYSGRCTADDESPTPRGGERLREGSRLENEPGHFEAHGGRMVFQSDCGLRLTVLENLNLERVVHGMADDPRRHWLVSGQITEFQAGNFLLIDRAISRLQPVRKQGAASPAPQRGTPPGRLTADRHRLSSTPTQTVSD